MRLPLKSSTLAGIGETRVDGRVVEVPAYPRELRQRICHIGVGGFHRSHQAVYLHRVLQSGSGDGWGICGIALRSADRPLFEALDAQDFLYSVWEVDSTSTRVSVIGSLMSLVDASEDTAPACAVLSDAQTRIVSLTITEAGYCLDAGGELNASHADIVADLAHPERPRSAQGVIVKALAARREAGLGGFTLMSCDNLIENGHRLRSSILGFAQRLDTSLAQWIAENVSFPSSMVDRITPVAHRERSQALCERWGVDDRALVLCEPWLQWILEDDFVAGRPAFERVGVVLTDRVKAFEDMKVGLLNGGHSALAHLGLLTGHVKVHEALAQAPIRQWLLGYMREVAGTLSALPGVDFEDYQARLIERFLNPAIEDRLQRLAQDTSSKFQQALLPPLLKRLERSLPFEHLAAALALWIVYLARLRTQATAYEAYQDAQKDRLIDLATAAVGGAGASPFLQACLPLPQAYQERVCDRVDHHVRGLNQAGYYAQLSTLGTSA